MVFLIKRMMAQFIDLILGYLLLFITFGYVMPWMGHYITNDIVRTIVGMVLMIGIYYLIQYPFMVNGQTVGKGFYRMKIVSTDEERENVPIAVVFQREILCKVMSCFFICLPLLSGNLGGHEEATHTKLVLLKK